MMDVRVEVKNVKLKISVFIAIQGSGLLLKMLLLVLDCDEI
jgi:hypothetical protein